METSEYREFLSLLELEISEHPTDDEINGAFRKTALKYHPDKGGSEQCMKRLTELHTKWKETTQPSCSTPRPAKRRRYNEPEPDLYCEESMDSSDSEPDQPSGRSYYEDSGFQSTQHVSYHFNLLFHLRDLLNIVKANVGMHDYLNVFVYDLIKRHDEMMWDALWVLWHGRRKPDISQMIVNSCFMDFLDLKWALGRLFVQDEQKKFVELEEVYDQIDWHCLELSLAGLL